MKRAALPNVSGGSYRPSYPFGFSCVDILKAEDSGMFAATRFLWNATRGNRLTPWRSEFLKWRIETYSGTKAESIDARSFFQFLWEEKAQLLRFLSWTNDFAARTRIRS